MPLFNALNRCWLLYLVGGMVLFKMTDHSMIDLQYLNSYRTIAPSFIECVPYTCTEDTLYSGLSYYSHWLDLFPASMEANNVLGYCFYHLHDYKRSFEYFSQAVDLEPNNPTLYYNQALALLKLGDLSKARVTLKKGLGLVSAGSLLRPDLIYPLKKTSGLDASSRSALIYYFTVFEYSELISLTDQIEHTSDEHLKKKLINELEKKTDSLELFYYVPMHRADVQGKQIVMI